MEQPIPLPKISSPRPQVPTSRLKSRRSFYKCFNPDFQLDAAWRTEWTTKTPRGGAIINDPCHPLPEFDTATRRQWVCANRLRSGHARTAVNLHRWGFRDSPLCLACNQEPQDTDHLVLHCPVTRLRGEYRSVHNIDENFTTWIADHNLEL